MKINHKYWIIFQSPGSFVANENHVDFEEKPEPKKVEWPKNAYSFRIFTRRVVDEGEIFEGKAKQIGPLYYHPDSKIENLDQVKKNSQATHILIRNMECNEWEYIIWSRWGNWPQPFNPDTCEILK